MCGRAGLANNGRWHWGHCVPLAALCLLAVGCRSGSGTTKKGPDPLLPTPGQQSPAPAPQKQARAAALPRLPETPDGHSNAAMTVGPLPGGRDLSIPALTANSAGNHWQGSGWGQPPGGGTQLQPPVGIPSDPLVNTAAVQPVPAVSASNEILLAELKRRGVTWQQAKQTPQGVHFSAVMPHPQNPELQRHYEATAPDAVSAMREVIKKIDDNR